MGIAYGKLAQVLKYGEKIELEDERKRVDKSDKKEQDSEGDDKIGEKRIEIKEKSDGDDNIVAKTSEMVNIEEKSKDREGKGKKEIYEKAIECYEKVKKIEKIPLLGTGKVDYRFLQKMVEK